MNYHQNFTVEELANEIWKDIPRYRGLYQVSNLGRVKSLERIRRNKHGYCKTKEKILKPWVRDSGHLTVNLRKYKDPKGERIHRLVLETFVGSCPKGMECCHFPDPDPTNNRIENLRWGTRSDNMSDSVVHGTDTRGERNGMSAITNEKAKEVMKLWKENRYKTKRELSRATGVSYATIQNITLGITWRHIFDD